MTDSPTAVYQRFNMRVDLSDPAVIAFMAASGIPREDSHLFDREALATDTIEDRRFEAFRQRLIREFGLTELAFCPSGGDWGQSRYYLTFADGGKMQWSPDFFWSVREQEDWIELFYAAVLATRHPPLDQIGGAM